MDPMTILTMVDTIFGLDVTKQVLALFVQSPELTEEEKANLNSNFEDYANRKARLQAEIEANEPGQ